MKDQNSHFNHGGRSMNDGNQHSELKAMEKEIQRLQSQISKMERANEVLWSTSVVKIIFKNEVVARKYRSKIENFLKNTLEKGEDFIVNCQICSNTEQEFEEVSQAFHIDKILQNPQKEKSPKPVPHYSSAFEDILHCDEPENPEVVEKSEDKPQTVTCFNCLGNHHMKNCPDKLDRTRISANKKEILVGSTVRYHTDEQNSSMRPGCLNEKLKKALGLKDDQLPRYIYHMRVLGYPPGWMDEAIIETSGLSLYDTEGKAIEDRSTVVHQNGTIYDGAKFIKYPGFNSPVPNGSSDEWEALRMPPLQPHQQLTEALKAPNTVNGSNASKRKKLPSVPENEVKKVKNGVESVGSANNLYSDWAPESGSTPKQNLSYRNHGSGYVPKTPDKSRHSVSISQSPGTPILQQGNSFNKLPDAQKFAEGITEHLPFENLPDAVGKFEKMRGVLSDLQKKMSEIGSHS